MSGKVMVLIVAVLGILLCKVDFMKTYRYIMPEKYPLSEVAVINFQDLFHEKFPSDLAILSSMKEYGFFYVTKIPEYSAEEELKYLKEFFDLPDEKKMALAVNKHNKDNRNVYRGYGPVVEGSGTQHKEMFNIGPHETNSETIEELESSTQDELAILKAISKEGNVWPKTENEKFNSKFEKLFKDGLKLRQDIARSIIRSIGRSLQHPNLIERFRESEFSTLGLRKYPLRKSTNMKQNMNSEFDNVTLSELEHEDSTVTILSTFNNTGLQVLYQDRYWDIPPSGNGFIINIGTLVEDIADNKILAVRHRVKQMDFIRHSIPCFFNPSFDADISRSISGRQTKAGKKHNIFGEWMRSYLPAVEPGLLNANFIK